MRIKKILFFILIAITLSIVMQIGSNMDVIKSAVIGFGATVISLKPSNFFKK